MSFMGKMLGFGKRNKENLGVKVDPPNPQTAATTIQSSWRGKHVRKDVKRKNLAAINIQRLFRGINTRMKFMLEVRRVKEQAANHAGLKDRMREINVKERDLKLMASISPEQYLNFERLRRDRSAKVIQNAWRSNVDRKQCEGAIDGMRGSKSSAAVRRSVQRFAKQYKNTKKKPNVKEESVDKPDILDGSPLESFLRESIKDNAKLFPRSDELPDFTLDEHALGLSQLYQRIRTTVELKAKGESAKGAMKHSGGVRHRYKELLEAQQKASILLQEYFDQNDNLEFQKDQRRRVLATTKRALDDLRSLPSLDEAATCILNSKEVNVEAEMEKARKWLYGSNLNSKYEHVIPLACKQHLSALDLYSNSRQWNSVYVPLASHAKHNIGKSNLFPTQLHQMENLQNLANRWATGNDIEESMHWVVYASQPNLAYGNMDVEKTPVDLSSRYKEFQNSLLSANSSYASRMTTLLKKYEEGKQRIDRLSRLVEQNVWDDIKRKFSSEAESLRLQEYQKNRLRAIIMVQTAIRRYIARMRANALRSQRRIMEALQNLLHEIAASDNKGHRNAKMVDPIISTLPAMFHSTLKEKPNSAMTNVLHSALKGGIHTTNNKHNSEEAKRSQPQHVPPRVTSTQSSPFHASNALRSSNDAKIATSTPRLPPMRSNRNSIADPVFGADAKYTPALQDTPNVSEKATNHLDRMYNTLDTPIIADPVGRPDFRVAEGKSRTPDKFSPRSPPKSARFDSSVSDNLSVNTSSTTPQKRHNDDKITPSYTHDSSGLLSPFLEMPVGTDQNYGYISPPSQSHSLSRSLSVSFGRVTDKLSPVKEEFNAISDSPTPFVSVESLGVFSEVARRYEANQCRMQKNVDAAIVVHIANFDKNSALNVFNDIIKRFSFHNIVNWLFGLAGLEREIEVEHCSVVCCELWSIDKDELVDSEMYDLINFCTLMRLFGASTQSGNVSVYDLRSLLEDLWSAQSGKLAESNCRLLAQIKNSICIKATRTSRSNKDILHDILHSKDLSSNSAINIEALGEILQACFDGKSFPKLKREQFQQIADYLHGMIQPVTQEKKQCRVSDIEDVICSCPSFRSLQSKIQIWFRAVPKMYSSLLDALTSRDTISKSEFSELAIQHSHIPLTVAESLSLARVIAGRDSPDFIDLRLLGKLRSGEYIQVYLL